MGNSLIAHIFAIPIVESRSMSQELELNNQSKTDTAPARQVKQQTLSNQLKSVIDERLEHFFQDCSASSRLGFAARHGLLSPGKRLRPIITILAGGQSDDASYSPALLDAACAVEMVHAASLIMDDLPSMDNAKLRRGAPTTHVVFGEAAATLAAIALLNEAYKTITKAKDVPADARLRAMEYLTNAVGIEGLAGGQDQDISCQGDMGKIDNSDSIQHSNNLKDMEKRHLEKTGALFAAAAAIGGEFAGLESSKIDHLFHYGCHLGLAYQAYDDVVDVSTCTSQSGKDTDQDQDKSTVVSILGTDGARILAERHLERAISAAKSASVSEDQPLADLARQIGMSFNRLTS